MALEDLSLSALEKNPEFKALFDQAMGNVAASLTNDNALTGKRSIKIDIEFKPQNGYVITTMECESKVPGKVVAQVATVNDYTIKVDTVSKDARQPDMLESAGVVPDQGKKVTPITSAPSAAK